MVTADALRDAEDDPDPDCGGVAREGSGADSDAAEVDGVDVDGVDVDDAVGEGGDVATMGVDGASVTVAAETVAAGTVMVTSAVSVALVHPAAINATALTAASRVVVLRRAGVAWECAVMLLLLWVGPTGGDELPDRSGRTVGWQRFGVTRGVAGATGRVGIRRRPPLRHLWGKARTHMPWRSAFISAISPVWLVVMVSARARASGF